MTDDQLEEILELWKAGRFYQAGTHASDLVAALRSAWVTTARLKDHAALLNLENAETEAKFKLLESQIRAEVRSELIAAAFTEGTLKAGDAMRDRMLQVEKERDEARSELERTRAAEAANSALLAEMSDTPAEKRVSDLEWQLAMLRNEYRPADEIRAQLLAEMEAHAETKAELAEAVRLGDERLATLWDEKKAEINRLQTQLDGNGMILTAISMIVGDRPGLVEAVQQIKAELKAANETIDMLYERSGRFAAQADRYEQELKAAKEEIIRLRRHLGEIP